MYISTYIDNLLSSCLWISRYFTYILALFSSIQVLPQILLQILLMQNFLFACVQLNYRKKLFFFFALNFLPWEFLFVKKLEIEKTKTTKYTAFKTDIIKVVLVFSISKFFTNENSQEGKLSAV